MAILAKGDAEKALPGLANYIDGGSAALVATTNTSLRLVALIPRGYGIVKIHWDQTKPPLTTVYLTLKHAFSGSRPKAPAALADIQAVWSQLLLAGVVYWFVDSQLVLPVLVVPFDDGVESSCVATGGDSSRELIITMKWGES